MLKKFITAIVMMQLIIFPAFMRSLAYSDTNNLRNQISENRIEEYIESLQSFGTRYSFSENRSLAASWLFNKFSEFRLWVQYQYFDYSNVTMRNVVATLNGSSSDIFIIGAHYDSVNIMDAVKSIDNASAPAPGANDDSSGVAVVLECARLLADYNLNISVMFVAFGCEEQGMHGSEALARKLAEENKTVIGMLNLDMVSYPHNSNLTLTYNSNSEWLATAIENISKANFNFSILRYLDECAVCDQAPFWKYNFSAVLISEDYYKNLFGLSYPHLHSANDTSDKLNFSFIAEIARLCFLAILRIPSLPPDLELENIDFSPLEPYCNEIISISITLRNLGSATNATLKIYGYSYGTVKLIRYENISVDACSTRQLSFNYTFLTPGRHLIYAVVENSTYTELDVSNNVRYRIIDCRASEKISTNLSLLFWLLLFVILAIILSFFVRVYLGI